MKTTLLLVACGALALVWSFERFSGAQLAMQIDARSGQSRELTGLQRERERLRRLQPGADELEQLRRAATQAAQLKAAVAQAEAAHDRRPAPLPLGEWSRAGDWKNHGSATPQAAIESALWAAAGGDVDALKKLFVLSPATQEKAAALLARLPAETRGRFASADDLVAEFTIKSIPVGEAQLVWFNQNGDDDASACVFLQDPPTEGGTAPPEPPRPVSAPAHIEESGVAPVNATSRGAAERRAAALMARRAAHPKLEPPRAPETSASAETYLSLHREADGWRIVVPVDAVTQIAKDLGMPPTP